MPSVVSYSEMFGSRDFTETLNSNGLPVLTHTRKFKVVLDDGGAGADATAYNVSASTDPLRSSHPQNSLARAKRRTGRSISNDDKIWEIDIEYDTDTASEDENDEQHPDNPLDEPWEIELTHEQFSRPLDKDLAGKAVTNSADEQFDPLPEIDDSRIVLRVTRNEATLPIALTISHANAVNSDTFLGVKAGYVKAKPITSTKQTKRLKDGALQTYYRCTYEFHFRDPDEDDDWDLHILDQGYRTIFDEGGEIGEIYLGILDSQDMPIAKPAKLDGNGAELAIGAEAKFLDFKAYKRRAFSAFGINSI